MSNIFYRNLGGVLNKAFIKEENYFTDESKDLADAAFAVMEYDQARQRVGLPPLNRKQEIEKLAALGKSSLAFTDTIRAADFLNEQADIKLEYEKASKKYTDFIQDNIKLISKRNEGKSAFEKMQAYEKFIKVGDVLIGTGESSKMIDIATISSKNESAVKNLESFRRTSNLHDFLNSYSTIKKKGDRKSYYYVDENNMVRKEGKEMTEIQKIVSPIIEEINKELDKKKETELITSEDSRSMENLKTVWEEKPGEWGDDGSPIGDKILDGGDRVFYYSANTGQAITYLKNTEISDAEKALLGRNWDLVEQALNNKMEAKDLPAQAQQATEQAVEASSPQEAQGEAKPSGASPKAQTSANRQQAPVSPGTGKAIYRVLGENGVEQIFDKATDKRIDNVEQLLREYQGAEDLGLVDKAKENKTDEQYLEEIRAELGGERGDNQVPYSNEQLKELAVKYKEGDFKDAREAVTSLLKATGKDIAETMETGRKFTRILKNEDGSIKTDKDGKPMSEDFFVPIFTSEELDKMSDEEKASYLDEKKTEFIKKGGTETEWENSNEKKAYEDSIKNPASDDELRRTTDLAAREGQMEGDLKYTDANKKETKANVSEDINIEKDDKKDEEAVVTPEDDTKENADEVEDKAPTTPENPWKTKKLMDQRVLKEEPMNLEEKKNSYQKGIKKGRLGGTA